MTLKIAVFAPMPSASVSTAIDVNNGAPHRRRSIRPSLPSILVRITVPHITASRGYR